MGSKERGTPTIARPTAAVDCYCRSIRLPARQNRIGVIHMLQLILLTIFCCLCELFPPQGVRRQRSAAMFSRKVSANLVPAWVCWMIVRAAEEVHGCLVCSSWRFILRHSNHGAERIYSDILGRGANSFLSSVSLSSRVGRPFFSRCVFNIREIVCLRVGLREIK